MSAAGCLIISADGTTVTGTDGTCTVVSAADFEGATIIGPGVFSGNQTLTSVNMSGTSVTSIGQAAFAASNLTNITFPSTLNSIGENAFAQTRLTSVDLSGTSLTSIGRTAFQNSSTLTTVMFPSSLTTIEDGAFIRTGLTSADLSGTSLISIGGAAFQSTNLNSISFPLTLTSIGGAAFFGLTSLTNAVVLPPSLTFIGESAFNSCHATILVLSKTATIGRNPFYTDTVYSYSDSTWSDPSLNDSGALIYLIDSISAADLTLNPGDTETITVTPNIAASASYIPSITWASSNTAAATLTTASTGKGVMTNTINGIADGTSTITITAAQVGSDIFGAAAVPAIPAITITATVGTGVSNIPTTGGEGSSGVSGTQNNASLSQYEAAVYATPVITSNGNTALVITNTHYPELINITVFKIWDDNDNRDNYRPDAICVTLTAAADSVEEEVWNQTLSATNANPTDANEWSYIFEDMVKFYDGYQIAYTLAEDSGSCAAQVTKTASNCEISGGRWENNSCTPFHLFDPNHQSSGDNGGGSAAPDYSSLTTQEDCTAAEPAGVWHPGSCSDSSFTTQEDCVGASESWTTAYCAAD
ncbi:MAG: leucine-rich repeat protein [Anaerolineaceae bacterium]|nr:leucine-rich repeat protein [Anaerolineaceae bacterium]